MQLKSQDLLVTLKLVVSTDPWRYADLATSLGLGQGETHAAVKRAIRAGLLVRDKSQPVPMQRNLLEFLGHGIRYVFVPDRGKITRGMPTAWAASPLAEMISGDQDPAPVWPCPEGTVRGESFSPLYRSVPLAARNDRRLYEVLALVDAMRDGRSRERKMAMDLLHDRIRTS